MLFQIDPSQDVWNIGINYQLQVLRTKPSTVSSCMEDDGSNSAKKRHSLKLQFADSITTWSLNPPTCTRYFPSSSANNPFVFFSPPHFAVRFFEVAPKIYPPNFGWLRRSLKVFEIAAPFPSVISSGSHLVLKYLYRSGNLKNTPGPAIESRINLMMLWMMAVKSHQNHQQMVG